MKSIDDDGMNQNLNLKELTHRDEHLLGQLQEVISGTTSQVHTCCYWQIKRIKSRLVAHDQDIAI